MIFKNNKIYDVLKWVVITASPALIALITGLGVLFGFDSAIITGTISLVTTFVGTLIGISSVQYANANKPKESKKEIERNDENGAA